MPDTPSMEPEPGDRPEDDLEISKIALRRHWVLLVVILLGTVIGAYVTVQFVMTELFETKTSVLVKLGRENTELPATVQKGSVLTVGVRREELNSVIQLLSSRSLITEVVDHIGLEAFRAPPVVPHTLREKITHWISGTLKLAREQISEGLIALGLARRLTEREQLVLAIEGSLSVAAERESDVISVRLRFPDPDVSVRLLNTLLELYLDRHVQVRRELELTDVFRGHVMARKREVEQIDAAREEVKVRFGLVSIAEQRTLLLRQLDAVKGEIEANETKKATLDSQRAIMRGRIASLPDELRHSQSINPNPSVQARKDRLAVLQQERARLATHYLPDSQVLRNVDREIATLTELLSKEELTLVGAVTFQANPVKASFVQSIEETGVQLAGLEVSIQQLRGRIGEMENRLKLLNEGEGRLKELERERQIAEESYLLYVKRMEESLVAEELDRRRIVNISVLSPPVRAITPVSPRKLFIVGLSVPIGLLIGVSLALIMEYLSDVIRTPRDLVRMRGITYLGAFRA